MNTEECKELLVEEYPDTEENQWRRVSKYKNSFGEDVRQFSHPEIGSVWLLDDEDDADIYTSCNHSNVFKKGGLEPSDYLYCIEDYCDLNDRIVIYFVIKKFFEINKCIDDRHDMLPSVLISKSFSMEDVAENSWSPIERLNAKDAAKKLTELGFSQDTRLDKVINGLSPSRSSHHRDDPGPGF